MIDKQTGEILTKHTTNPVPFIIISEQKTILSLRKNGRLADVAPTVLKLLGIPVLTIGPEGGNAHEPNEWVSARSLEKLTEFIKRLLVKYNT